MSQLVDRIRRRISAIPATNPGILSLYPDTLSDILSHSLLQKIAKEAAAAAREELFND